MCVETLRTRLIFPRWLNLRGHMTRFTWKMNVFPSICLKLHKWVLELSEQGSFFRDNWFKRSHAQVSSKNEHFPIYLLGNTINVCWNPQNRVCFSETIGLRGHMPRFTLKMNVFPSISLESPEMCVETIRTGFVFLRRSIWGVTCLGLLEKLMFSHISPWKPHKCVLKPSEQGSFFKMIDLRGHMPRSTLKMNVFPSISLETA